MQYDSERRADRDVAWLGVAAAALHKPGQTLYKERKLPRRRFDGAWSGSTH
jgi:hypothetical protein